jgi:hypothetical protein
MSPPKLLAVLLHGEAGWRTLLVVLVVLMFLIALFDWLAARVLNRQDSSKLTRSAKRKKESHRK